MIRVPDGAEDRDISRWLYYVFMHMPEGGTPRPMIYDRVEDGTVTARTINPGGRSQLVFVPASECYAHWPKLGAFNLSNQRDAVYLFRTTVRQWVRSLSPDTLGAKKLDGLPGGVYANSAQYVTAPYEHSGYLDAAAAVDAVIRRSRNSCAITRRIAVGAGMCPTKVSLFVDGDLAGTVHGRNVLVFPEVSMDHVTKVFGGGFHVTQNVGS